MRTIRKQFLDWLWPQCRQHVLTLLLGDARKRWHLRDVVRKTGGAVGTVRRELKGLTACGIARENRDGNRLYYQANVQCPIYPELSALIRKTSGLGDVLCSALTGICDRIEQAFIFGSQARGEAGPDSDVDLLIIGRVSFAEVVSALAEAQQQIGREINPTVYSPEEFRNKVFSGHHFVCTILREPKIFLIGDENELGKLAK